MSGARKGTYLTTLMVYHIHNMSHRSRTRVANRTRVDNRTRVNNRMLNTESCTLFHMQFLMALHDISIFKLPSILDHNKIFTVSGVLHNLEIHAYSCIHMLHQVNIFMYF
jgi:hypothetical protein